MTEESFSTNKEYSKEKLIQELIFDEGKRLAVYRDSLGHRTIGIGHLIKKGEKINNTITEPECLNLLYSDIKITEKILTTLVPGWRTLDDVRQRALLNLTFNLGYGLKFFRNFLNFIFKKEWRNAGEQLKKSKWWNQVGKRSERIYQMIVYANDEVYKRE